MGALGGHVGAMHVERGNGVDARGVTVRCSGGGVVLHGVVCGRVMTGGARTSEKESLEQSKESTTSNCMHATAI